MDDDPGKEHWLQRLYDSPLILLILGMVIMLMFYTGWGLYEVASLPEASLP